jgi:hypothetical protein
MRIVSATVRGVSAAGRTLAMTVIAGGTESSVHIASLDVSPSLRILCILSPTREFPQLLLVRLPILYERRRSTETSWRSDREKGHN